MKQSFVAGLYATGLALSNYALPGTDPDADLTTWFAAINAGEPYDTNPLSQDIADETTTHHSSYYIDDATAPAPLLISNGWTDDLFPPDEAIRFYNRTRANHPGTPIALIFSDHGHQRGQNKAVDATFRARQRRAWLDFYVRGIGPQPFLGVQTLTQTCGAAVRRLDRRLRRSRYRPAVLGADLGRARARRDPLTERRGADDRARGADRPARSARPSIRSPAAARARPRARADQIGAATYRLDPAPGRRLHAHGLADHRRRRPLGRRDLAARGAPPRRRPGERHADAGRARALSSGDQRRPATRQVFQLHPNGWKFAEGHVAKLELLPADQPYGRNSNGQAARSRSPTSSSACRWSSSRAAAW